ncbi:uncharacterized protein EI97DRAFT_436148 [Westerdykella ornata]|uniref:Secreted protein n=1 Tax=Westerdykella ornata TaxID=318751 RepID=A0A6A6J9K8_WESOR|nr:uncharacterized protein EI97DRAFT_436148 [Westerdykella ornata]KAF2273270.1 hypothetical protein EI97DRAFT_436148 [Westerdykella ornata]
MGPIACTCILVTFFVRTVLPSTATHCNPWEAKLSKSKPSLILQSPHPILTAQTRIILQLEMLTTRYPRLPAFSATGAKPITKNLNPPYAFPPHFYLNNNFNP